MTVGIVIPLKAKRVSRDWNAAASALKRTLNSIFNQSDDDYFVVITGHDCPEFLMHSDNNKVDFIEASFPAPDRNSEGFVPQDLINDKNLKIISGLYALRNKKLSFIFQLDSDDLLHKDFIASLKAYKSFDAMILQGGYLYYQSSERYIETVELDQYCGSTVVVRAGSFEMPTEVSLDMIYQVPWTRYRHMNIYKYFEIDTKQQVVRNQDKLVAYLLASGDNFSDRWRDNWVPKLKWKLKPYIRGKKADTWFNNLFGL